MEDVTIESLIAQRRVVTTADLIAPANDYMVVGVYQKGTNPMKGDGTSYKNYVISIAELLGGGSVYTASNGITLVGNDFQLTSNNISQFTNDSGYLTATTVANVAWKLDGNTVGSEKFLGTIDNFALPFRVNNNEVARFTTDGPELTRLYINANTNLHGSNAGIQYSTTFANRAQLRTNAYGNHTGVAGVTGFKSRGATVGSLASVVAGDTLFRITAIGVSGDNASLNLAALVDLKVSPGGVFPAYVATDFTIDLMNLAGVRSQKLILNSEGNLGIGISTPISKLQVDGPIGGTTILGPVLDNLGGWTHLITVSGGNGISILESGGSTNVLANHRVDITGGDGGHINVYNNLGVQKILINGAVGSNKLIVQNDAATGGLEVQADGDVIAYQNLGVGIALPTVKLHVKGVVDYAGNPIIRIENLSNTAYATINDDGNMYISSNQYTGIQWQVNGAMVTQIITTGADIAKQRLPTDYTFTRNADDFILGGKSGNNWFFQAASNTAITPTSKVDIEGENAYDQLRLRKTFTPANSADANGNVGDFAWDTGFVYIKVTGLGWTRAALATF